MGLAVRRSLVEVGTRERPVAHFRGWELTALILIDRNMLVDHARPGAIDQWAESHNCPQGTFSRAEGRQIR